MNTIDLETYIQSKQNYEQQKRNLFNRYYPSFERATHKVLFHLGNDSSYNQVYLKATFLAVKAGCYYPASRNQMDLIERRNFFSNAKQMLAACSYQELTNMFPIEKVYEDDVCSYYYTKNKLLQHLQLYGKTLQSPIGEQVNDLLEFYYNDTLQQFYTEYWISNRPKITAV